MAKNPISLNGLKAILNRINGEVLEAVNAGVEAKAAGASGLAVEVDADMRMEGEFGVNKNGELDFSGKVEVRPPIIMAPWRASAGGGPKKEWASKGNGTLSISYRIKAVLPGG